MKSLILAGLLLATSLAVSVPSATAYDPVSCATEWRDECLTQLIDCREYRLDESEIPEYCDDNPDPCADPLAAYEACLTTIQICIGRLPDATCFWEAFTEEQTSLEDTCWSAGGQVKLDHYVNYLQGDFAADRVNRDFGKFVFINVAADGFPVYFAEGVSGGCV